MRRIVSFVLLLLLSPGPSFGQVKVTPCKMDGSDCGSGGGGGAGTVTTTGSPTSGQVGVISGATSVTGDSGLTYDTVTKSFAGTGPWTNTPLSDVPTLTLRRFGAAQTNYVLQIQTEGNGFLSGVNALGTYVGPVTALKSATTSVDVSTATAPSTGQVLTATDSTHATWQAVPTLNQNTTGTAAKANALNSATTVVNVSAAAAPSANQVLMATSSTAATWQTVPAFNGVLPAGTATVAPLKFTTGVNLSVPEAGAVEFANDSIFITGSTPQAGVYSSVYPPAQNGTYVKATLTFNNQFYPYFATDPTKSLTSNGCENNCWYGDMPATQRFHIDLGSAKTVKRIYYEGFRSGGSQMTNGVKDFTFWGSNDSGAFSTLTYATDTNWTQLTATPSQFAQHVNADASDPQYAIIANTTPYRYYALKIGSSWGNNIVGIRRLELQEASTTPVRREFVQADATLTPGRIPYVTTNGRVTNTSLTEASAGAIATTAGTNLSLTATAPAATTGASQAGKAVSITASPAVASTDTAGAAAGGSVTITAGAAARNTSGDANGGDISLVCGAAIGTGRAGNVIIGSGVGLRGAAAMLTVTDGASGSGGITAIGTSSLGRMTLNGGYFAVGSASGGTDALIKATSDAYFGWSSTTSLSGATDTWLSRGGAATPQLGAANAAAPVAQTLGVQGARGGTDTNTAGQPWILRGSLGTGTAAAGALALKTGYPTSTGTTQHVVSTRTYIPGAWTALTAETATPIATLTFGASSVIGGQWLVTIKANDASDFQAVTYRVVVNSIRNAAGNTVSTVAATADAVAAGTGTLTATFSVTEGASAAVLNCTATSSLTETTLAASWQSLTNGAGLALAQN